MTAGERPQARGDVRLRAVCGDPEVGGDDRIADERVGRDRQPQRCQRRAAAHPLVDIEVAGLQHGDLEVAPAVGRLDRVARRPTSGAVADGLGDGVGRSASGSASASGVGVGVERRRRSRDRAASRPSSPTSRQPRYARRRRHQHDRDEHEDGGASCATGHRRLGRRPLGIVRLGDDRDLVGRATACSTGGSRGLVIRQHVALAHRACGGRRHDPGAAGSACRAEASPVVAGRRWAGAGESSCRPRTCERHHCRCRDQGEQVHDDPRVEHLTPSRTLAGVVVKKQPVPISADFMDDNGQMTQAPCADWLVWSSTVAEYVAGPVHGA